MTNRTCLLVDDSKQDDVIPAIQNEGKKYNITINCLQFNVGSSERRDLLSNEEIDLQKVIDVFDKEFEGIKIDLIAFDWNLSSQTVNGPLIIKALNDKNKRTKIPKILYSGILKDEIEKLCENYRKNSGMQFKDIWGTLNTLISTGGILTFVHRDDYEIGIVEQLRKINDTIENNIEAILIQFPDFKFEHKFINNQFEGKTFKEISNILSKDTNLSNEFTREITSQIIAYLTERL